MTDKIPLVIVAAISRKNRALGNKNGLLWHIPEDLKRFKEKTLGHPIIMGRKTFESILSILGKPLPGRQTIVITRNKDYRHEGVTTASSLEEGLKIAATYDPLEIHIGGGAEMYAQALPFVDKLYLTLVDDEPQADTFFPPFEDVFTLVQNEESQTYKGLTYEFRDYVRE